MLTFDGGYESFYTIVWPQLREQAAKGTVAVSGAEADLYSGSVEKEIASSRLSWNQLSQMDRSDAVEISSAGYGLMGDWTATGSGKHCGGSFRTSFPSSGSGTRGGDALG